MGSLPAESMPGKALPIGTCLERYELKAVLGQGGCGITYLAEDSELLRDVVLKEHFPLGLCRRMPDSADVKAMDSALYERSLQTFCREARILAGLKHEGIVAVHEIFSACGTAFLVMDYVEGQSLREWMQTRPYCARILKVLNDLLNTLEYLHASGVVHRDIKPDNIIVQQGDKPILIDFGAALLGDPTHTLTLVGTPSYAAPEQFVTSVVPGPQADIYALGRSFHRVAADCGHTLPRSVRRTLCYACAEQPEKRYRNASEWRRAIKIAALFPVCISAGVIILATIGGVGYWLLSAPEIIASQHEDTTAQLPDKGATNTPDEFEQDLPKYHPIQLVHYDEQGELKRYSDAVLPPREEEFVKSVVAAQQALDDSASTWYKESRSNGKFKSRSYYTKLYKGQKELNNKVVSLIRDFIDRYYHGKDPHAYATDMLIFRVQQNKLEMIRPLAEYFVTHPRHLVAYDENGFLVRPGFQKRRGTQNEENFISDITRIQQEYHNGVKKAEEEALSRQQPLSEEQRAEIARNLQLEVNEKVLKEVDEYIESYEIDETHPEYQYNASLREEVKNKNIQSAR